MVRHERKQIRGNSFGWPVLMVTPCSSDQKSSVNLHFCSEGVAKEKDLINKSTIRVH